MDWARERHDWPHADLSRFVDVGGTRWHLQQAGEGRGILLLHGTGATTHSFAELLPLLAEHARVTAIDLPGHGFSGPVAGGRPALPTVAAAVQNLLNQEGIEPDIIVGHSAGAAIAVRMVVSGGSNADAIVAINGAFFPFEGVASHWFPAAAKLLFLNPLAPRLFAFGASSTARVQSLIRSTGSVLTPRGVELYRRALRSDRHVEGALAMMANWDLHPMQRHLRTLDVPMLQIVGARDGTIHPNESVRTAGLLKSGHRTLVEDAGHLVHEERSSEVAGHILDFAREHAASHRESACAS